MRGCAVLTPTSAPFSSRAMHTTCLAREAASFSSPIALFEVQNWTSSASSSGVTFFQTWVTVAAMGIAPCAVIGGWPGRMPRPALPLGETLADEAYLLFFII